MGNKFKIALFIISILNVMFLQGQIPRVNVAFRMEPNGPLHAAFFNQVPELEQEFSVILTNLLKKHIGFVDFTNNAEYKLLVLLKYNTEKNGELLNYELKFRISKNGNYLHDENDKLVQYTWEFLKRDEFNELKGTLKLGPDSLFNQLNWKFDEHLEDNYNFLLVKKLFRFLPITLPNNDYHESHKDGHIIYLPCDTTALRIKLTGSKFKISLVGSNQHNSGIPEETDDVQNIGVLNKGMKEYAFFGKPFIMLAFKSKIFIKKHRIHTLTSGKVYLNNYVKAEYSSKNTPLDFTKTRK